GEPLDAGDLPEDLASSMGAGSRPGAVPLAKSPSSAASARDPKDALGSETGRGSVLRRRGGHRSQPANRSRLDFAGTTTLGPHSRQEREALRGGSLESPNRPARLGRRRSKAELALLEPAADFAPVLPSRPTSDWHSAPPGPHHHRRHRHRVP